MAATLGRMVWFIHRRATFLGSFLLFAQLAAPAQNGTAKQPTPAAPTMLNGVLFGEQIAAIVNEPAVSRAHWGISVATLDGTPIFSLNDGQFFQPASNLKLFTTAAALALLPAEERLVTRVIGSGNYGNDGSFTGDLVLKGVGDANLSGRPVPYLRPVPGQSAPHRDELRYIDELADKVKAAGITRIQGNVVGDDSLMPNDPYPENWSIDDTPWYYGAPINALMIADNAWTLTIRPGAGAGASPTVEADPALPFYTVDMQAKTVAKGGESALDIQREMNTRTVHVYGTLAADAKPYVQEMSIGEPAEYTASALKAALEKRGITVSGTATAKHATFSETAFMRHSVEPVDITHTSPARTLLLAPATCSDCTTKVLAEHTGPLLRDDIAITNKTSENQHAELLLRQLGLFTTGSGTTVQGERVLRTWLTQQVKVDQDDFVFYDGSGLSGHDLVTPRAITRLLSYAATQSWGALWKDSLPVGGRDGSLRGRFPAAPLKDHIFAKTGTLGEVHALSGYIDCSSGQTLIFSVIVNDHTPRTNDDLKAMDRILAAIAAGN
ncbi:MAG: D-alanyl-D-alanine carboxypeptidase/D-alanyl-D-alanine endopeptidase [Janthinobacterium lividum]